MRNLPIQTLKFLLDPRSDIEVFGMYGAGNLGDEAMLVAARETLPSGRVIGTKMDSRKRLVKLLLQARHRQNLLIAGGTLIHGGDSAWLDYVEHRVRQGVKARVFGTGIAFLESERTKNNAAWRRWSSLLEDIGTVWLRGSQSVELARQMGARAEVFGDFAFLLHNPALALQVTPPVRPVIGLNFGLCLGDQAAFERAAADFVRRLPSSHDLAFYVVWERDIEPTRRIIAAAGVAEQRVSLSCHFYDPHAYMRAVAPCCAFLGLKLHAAGLAMVADVPSLMIAYMPKAHDFMSALGNRADLLLDLPFNPAEAFSRFERLLADRTHARLGAQIGAIAERQRVLLNKAYADPGP